MRNCRLFHSVNSNKDKVFVVVGLCKSLIRWFDVHARGAPRRPEIDDDRRCILYYLSKLLLRLDLDNFGRAIGLGRGSLLSWHAASHSRKTAQAAHSGNFRHTSSRYWLSTFLMNCLLLTAFIEKLMRVDSETILEGFHHWSKHFAHWSSQEFFALVDVFAGNSFAKQEFCAFIGEMIAIVFKDVVGVEAESIRDFFQKLHEHLFWNLSETNLNSSCWIAEWGSARWIIRNTSTEVVLFPVNNNACVPYPFELFANKGHRQILRHTLRQVVTVNRNRKRHQ